MGGQSGCRLDAGAEDGVRTVRAADGAAQEVVVRFVRADAYDGPALAAQACEILGADEREAHARLRPTVARLDYLAAHALARTTLAEFAGCEPSRLRLRPSPWGRPEIVTPRSARRLRFSLSHSDGMALCAVAVHGAVGADVESLRNIGPDPLCLAEAICCRREKDALRALPTSARAEVLLSMWTLKEAITKAMGLGFQFPFTRIAIHWEENRLAAVEFDSEAAGDASEWRLASLRLTPYHVAAVAARCAAADEVAIRFEAAASTSKWFSAPT